MLLTIFAFVTGCAIGRLRGGRASGMSSAQFRRPGLLVLGITTVLILNIIGPAFPIMWGIIGTIAFFAFGLRNLQLTGMIVMMIGLLMNTAPLLANGATPVSELALISVGDVDENGRAVVDGLRESTDTATAFAAFGDVVPVPVVNSVVSIGDVVMLVALADIAANLFLRSRRRDELERGELGSAGVTYAEGSDSKDTSRPTVLSPLNIGVSNRPAHASHRRPRRKAAPSTHVPAHAKQSDFFDLTDPATVIVLDGPDGYVESGVPKKKVPEVSQPEATRLAPPAPQAPIEETQDQLDVEEAELEEAEVAEAPEVEVPKTEITLPKDPQIYDEEAEEVGSDPQISAEESTKTVGSDPQAAQEEPASSRSDQAREVGTSTGSVDNKTERSSRRDQSEVGTSTGSVDNKTEQADRRPIIDLTESPTDEQLQEFLRRRAEADAAFLARTSPGPRRRRGRAPRRSAEVVETTR